MNMFNFMQDVLLSRLYSGEIVPGCECGGCSGCMGCTGEQKPRI